MPHLLYLAPDGRHHLRICVIPADVEDEASLQLDRHMFIMIASFVSSVNVWRPVQSSFRPTISFHDSTRNEMLSTLPFAGFKIRLIELRLACADAGLDLWANRLHASSPFSPGM